MFYTFFRLFSIYFTGTVAASVLIAKYVYAPMLRNSDDEDEPPPFEWGYLEELEAIAERELSSEELVKLGDCKLDAETPAGRVIMSYDEDAKSFTYYTDSKNVPFKYLDAMAREFAVKHDAKRICVNYGCDYIEPKEKPKNYLERSSVFVKLKPRSNAPKRVKKTNRFSNRGTIEQKWTMLETPSSMTFAEYKKIQH